MPTPTARDRVPLRRRPGGWPAGVLMAAVAGLLPVTVQADGRPGAPEQGECRERLPASTRCRWLGGTVAIYNGTPAVRIRPDRGGALLAVGPSEDEWMPDELKAALQPDQPLHGWLLVCPMPRIEPRGLHRVCVGAVRNLRPARR